MTEDEKRPTGERCFAAMSRVWQVLSEEFHDLGPPEFVFILNWLQHRYLTEVDAIAYEQSQPRPQPDSCKH
jgi:hypothetical protein